MKKKHILLIDDNAIDNYISKYIITKSGMAEKITVATSGIAALQLLRELKDSGQEFPDLIFLDIRMPMMDGFGFLQELEKFFQLTIGCSVIMLSSSSHRYNINRARQYPFVRKYFTKPLTLGMLESI